MTPPGSRSHCNSGRALPSFNETMIFTMAARSAFSSAPAAIENSNTIHGRSLMHREWCETGLPFSRDFVASSKTMPKSSISFSVWAGTRKGAFVFRSRNRKDWSVEGPFFRGLEIDHVARDPREPNRMYAAVNSAWFGAHIHASTDGGKTWKLSEAGLAIKC